MPGERAAALAAGTRTGVAAHPLRAHRLHAAAGTRFTRAPEQARALQPALPGQRRNLARDRSRSPPSRRNDRLLQRAPYLEPAARASSSCPLRCRGWRPRSRPDTLGPFPALVLPAGQGTEPGLPRQVPRRTEDRLPPGQACVLWPPRATGGTTDLRRMAAHLVPSRLGRLCQASLRRSGTRTALSQRIHASRRHLQPQTRSPRTRQRHLPLAGLRTRQQAAAPDATRRRVPAPLPPPPPAARIHAHPQLRIPRQPATRLAAATLLPVAHRFSDPRCTDHIPHPRSAPFLHILELPRPRRHHARRRTTLGGATAAALSTACPRMCRMNLEHQSRSLHMLRKRYRSSVSSRPSRPRDHRNHPLRLPHHPPFPPPPCPRPTHLARSSSHTLHPILSGRIENT